MADQGFLASFGVDIDEGGVSRLQQILTENRTLAESLSKSFEAASESVKAFKAQVTTDLPSLFSGNGYGNVTENLFGSLGGLKIGLNMTEPKKGDRFVSMVAVGAAFSEIEWLRVLSVSGVAFVLSILTSLATGLPEAEH